MGHVQPFVAIVLGSGPQQDAEQLARAAGAAAILRPGQPHPVPLHAPDAVIDLAPPDHDGMPGEAVIDLAPGDDTGSRSGGETIIDLVFPSHSDQPSPGRMPDTAVIIDPAAVASVGALVSAVHIVLARLAQLEPGSPGVCVVASRMVTDSLALANDAGPGRSALSRDAYPWVSAPLAGPLDPLCAAVGRHADGLAERSDGEGSPSVLPLIEELVRRGIDVRTVRI